MTFNLFVALLFLFPCWKSQKNPYNATKWRKAKSRMVAYATVRPLLIDVPFVM